MEPLNAYLVMELKATQEKLERVEKQNTKLLEENLFLEARLEREVDRTSDLQRWFQYFVNSNVRLEQELIQLREHCQRLERRIIVRDLSLDFSNEFGTESSAGDSPFSQESLDSDISIWE